MLASDGYVRCWGSNLGGELGNVSLSTMTHHLPTVVDTLTNVSQIAAGSELSCAIASQLLYCWGKNDLGQLGLGDTDARYAPELVPIGDVAHVSLTHKVACAVTTDSRVLCWGKLLDGQFWDGQAYSPIPTEVDGLQDLTTIAERPRDQLHRLVRKRLVAHLVDRRRHLDELRLDERVVVPIRKRVRAGAGEHLVVSIAKPYTSALASTSSPRSASGAM